MSLWYKFLTTEVQEVRRDAKKAMIELFAYKQFRCEHCEFEFSFTGFDSAAKIVCPACGEEIILSPPSPPHLIAAPPETAPPSGSPQEVLLAESPTLCSVEHCPLLTGGEVGDAVAEQLGIQIDKKKKRRRTILAWTVTLQVCMLLGVALVIAKTMMVPPMESQPDQPIAKTNIPEINIPEKAEVAKVAKVFPPLLPAVPEIKAAVQSHKPVVEPLIPISEPEQVVSTLDMLPDVLPMPVHDCLPLESQRIAEPNTLSAIAEHTLPSPVVSFENADQLLETAKILLATDPENSVEQAVQAAKIYKQLGQPFPDSMYWIIGNAFASLTWGEPLLESSPVIETMALSPDNRLLIAQLQDKTVRVWDLQNRMGDWSAGFLLDSGAAEYVKFVFTPESPPRWIIGGQSNGTIRIWDMNLNNPANTMITFAEHVSGLQDLQISPNGQWLAAYGHSSPSTMMAADKQGQPKPQPPISQVNYQRPVRHAYKDTSYYDASPYPLLLWNLRQMEAGIVPMAISVPPMPLPVQVIQFSPNSERLAVARKDAIVRVYDLTPQGVSDDPFILRGHLFPVTQIAFAPSGQWIATGSQDNTVRLWSLTSVKVSPESATLYGHLGWISTLTVDPTGEYLFSGSYDRTIRIWNVKQDRIGSALNVEPIILETNLGIPESILLTQDGDKIITRGNEGSLGIYHLPSILQNDFAEHYRAVTFRNSRLSISQSLLTSDDQLLIFSFEHLSNPLNSGIRLWSLQAQAFIH